MLLLIVNIMNMLVDCVFLSVVQNVTVNFHHLQVLGNGLRIFCSFVISTCHTLCSNFVPVIVNYVPSTAYNCLFLVLVSPHAGFTVSSSSVVIFCPNDLYCSACFGIPFVSVRNTCCRQKVCVCYGMS